MTVRQVLEWVRTEAGQAALKQEATNMAPYRRCGRRHDRGLARNKAWRLSMETPFTVFEQLLDALM
jgi:hypothetical protein